MTRTWILIIGVLATISFALIVLVILPQVLLVQVQATQQLQPYNEIQLRGRQVYIANGCLYCHSQQIRDSNYTTDVDRGWGARSSVPADYVYDAPHLLGTMRTGPDLVNIANRQPSPDWHLVHLYQPRALVEWSTMPAFPFLFEEKAANEVQPGERVITVPAPYAPANQVVVATPDALALTEYLLALKRDYPIEASELQEDLLAGLICVPDYGTTTATARDPQTMP
jgi:cytochrome c oxidase cbb3-type subunit II